MPTTILIIALVGGMMSALSALIDVRYTEGKWPWQTSESQSRKSRSFLSRLLSRIPGLNRLSSRPSQPDPTENSSPQGSDAVVSSICPHSIDQTKQICFRCRPSGSITLRMPDLVPGPASDAIRKELNYRAKVAGLPKEPGAYRMFRTWALGEDNRLRAMVATYHWTPGENIATSMADAKDHSGFYGFSSLAELQAQEKTWWSLSQSGRPYEPRRDPLASMMGGYLGHVPPGKTWYVCGTFLGYGHLKIAEHGARAERAVPEYIIEPDGSDPDFGLRIMNVAEKYGMKIISVKTARELATGRVPWWKGRPNT